MQETAINVGILILGVMMLGAGVQALRRPSLGVLLTETIVTVLRDLMRAFVGTRDAVRSAVAKSEAKRWTAVFNHPLGKLKYRFDKKNTDKLRDWLSTEPAPTAG